MKCELTLSFTQQVTEADVFLHNTNSGDGCQGRSLGVVLSCTSLRVAFSAVGAFLEGLVWWRGFV